MLTLQDAILRLHHYWGDRGCVLVQPFNTEVGAGTLNPATLLRVLGPEPWRTAYVEPSVRPDDSRYGHNPNRLQTHTQFQVILKPEPGNPQELYLASLQALDIDLAMQDVRFVEDNWESPAVGAWGLGWEVWLNGLEITQFTYFQQAGGMPVEPVAVELTYGLERILMALQGVTHFKDIQWAPGVTYGEMLGQTEFEMSTYYLDAADVESTWQLFRVHAAEARRMIDAGLPMPAHYQVLKCSHCFNVLDSRNAVGTNQRVSAFAQMRGLSREVAQLWVGKREEAGFPLGRSVPIPAPPLADPGPFTAGPQPLLLEIGCEELPWHDVQDAREQLVTLITDGLAAARLDPGPCRVVATPRRLVVTVESVASHQPDREVVNRGPRVSAAFDSGGNPTQAAIGFARARGIEPGDLERMEIGGHEHVVVRVAEAGLPAGDVLALLLPKVIGSLSFGRSMRWAAPEVAFSRPVRWIVALLGEGVIPFVWGNVASGRITQVHRGAQPVAVDSAGRHQEVLRAAGIEVDEAGRRAAIVAEGRRLAGEVGGTIDPGRDAALLTEITDLVEFPTVILGRFHEDDLAVPEAVLAVVMRKHQRYLPVYDGAGGLMPYFIAVANGSCDVDSVRAGNEAVLRARFADARFFWEQDLKTPLDEMRECLSRLVFTDNLGSMLEHGERTAAVAEWLRAELTPDVDPALLARAGHLVMADLGSQMVTELPAVAGIMGRIYAGRAGESGVVADAVFERVLPRFSGDALPSTPAGTALAMAERLDALVGLFGSGTVPKGSADPFGLRRSALGLIQIVVHSGLPVDLRRAIDHTAELQPVPVSPDARRDCLTFIVRRMEQWLLERHGRGDLVRAVLTDGHRPARAVAMLNDLEALAGTPGFATARRTFDRVSSILRGIEDGSVVDPACFEHESEHALWRAIQAVESDMPETRTVSQVVSAVGPLAVPLAAFFDGVMVLTKDERLRRNRIALLRQVESFGSGLIDWSAVSDPAADEVVQGNRPH